MRKLFCILAACVTAFAVAVQAEETYFNAHKDVGYVKPENWQCAQGLCCDGEYFYFAAHHDKTKELSDIHKIRMADSKEVAVFEKCAPWHSPGLDYWATHDSILSCCYGPKSMPRTPCVWEIDKQTGTVLGKWDCPEVGHKQGGLIAWEKKNDILLLTSVDNTPKVGFTRMTLLPDGKFVDNGTWYYEGPNFGILQGMDYRDGCVYLLADAGKTVNNDPHVIYVLKLNRDKEKTITIRKQYHFSLGVETEGLTFDPAGNVYFGTAEEKIYKLDKKYKKLKAWKSE